MLLGRVGGPFGFRLILQPLVATILAARDAIGDARADRPPYGWTVLTNPHRRELWHEGWTKVSRVFLAALVVDVIYQILEFRWVYPGQAVITAVVLAVLPYPLIRGLLNRIVRWLRPDAARRQA
jgi:hypothetical protein